MGKPTLYLMMGYPGSGKTAVAKMISEATGAVHLWSDVERHKMFGNPTHSETESTELYDALNRRAEELLHKKKSVVFDTNFNFIADRQKLKEIADKQGADTVLIWVVVPEEVARQRSVETGQKRNGYHTRMTDEQFDDIVAKLEPPTKDEKVIKIDGMKLDAATVLDLLSKYNAEDIALE